MSAGAEGPHHPLLAHLHDAARDEAFQRLLADGGRVLDGEHSDPGPRIRFPPVRRNLREGAVEHGVAGRRRVGDHERLGVGVDAIGKGQVHQHGTANGAAKVGFRDRHEGAVLVVQQKQENFFGEGQHVEIPSGRRVECQSDQ